MLPSDMNLKMGNIENFNNRILVSKSGFKLGKNEEINQPIIVKAFEGPRKPLPSQEKHQIEATTTISAEEHEQEKLGFDRLWSISEYCWVITFSSEIFFFFVIACKY